MVVADRHGLPISLHVDSARPHESQPVDATLATVRVPQKRGRARTRPKELVANRAYNSRDVRQRLRRRGIKPTIPTFERRQRWKPKRGRPIRVSGSRHAKTYGNADYPGEIFPITRLFGKVCVHSNRHIRDL